MRKMPALVFLAMIAVGMGLAGMGCDRSPKVPAAATAAPESPETELSGLLLTAPPAGATGSSEARLAAKPGDRIVLVGEIGGRKVGTFSDKMAIFLLADAQVIAHCGKKHGDGCPTPWDYCCEPKDKVTAALTVVQVKSPSTGKVLPVSLKGWNGLKELSQVTVVGTVDETSSAESLIVNLAGIYIQP
jgi:hypothetical protein